MRIIGKILITISALVIILILVGGGFYFFEAKKIKLIYGQLGEKAPVLKVDSLSFRDLNKNGKLDVY